MLDLRNRQIAAGSVLSYLSIIINIGAGLLYTPWILRQLGQSDYGLYTLSTSFIALFLVDFGLSTATTRFASNCRAKGDQEKLNSTLGAIYTLYLAIDAVIFVILFAVYFFIDNIYANLLPEEIEKFKVIYVILASYSVVQFPFATLNGILTAYEKFIQLKSADIAYRIFIIVVTIFVLRCGMGVYALVAVNALFGLLLVVYKLLVVRYATPVSVRLAKQPLAVYKEIFGFSIWVTVSALAGRLIFTITPTILGAVSDSAAIAVFGIVNTVEGYVFTITTAINGLFFPRISRIYLGEENESNIEPIMLTLGKYQFYLNSLIIIGFAGIGRQFVDLWVGPSYAAVYWGVLLVIVPSLFYNPLFIANAAMEVQNKVMPVAMVSVACGVVNVALSIPLSRQYGTLGACIAIAIAFVFRSAVVHPLFQKMLHIDMVSFAKKCYVRALPSVILSLAFSIFIGRITWEGWLGLIIKGVAVVIVFIICVWGLGLSGDDRKALRKRLFGT